MSIDNIIFIYWSIPAVLLIIAIYGYKAKVLKTLGEYGLDDKEKGLPSNQLKQIKEYKKVCLENNLSLKWYKYMAAFPIIGFGLLIGWVALLLWAESIK